MSKSKDFKKYHEKKKKLRKDGTIDAGKGKRRPHHKKALKGVKRTGDSGIDKHRRKQAEISYVPRTANKYQSSPKKVDEDGNSYTYEWLEDNGHKDHIQKKRTKIFKDMDRMPVTLSPPSQQYKDNYDEIFGEREMGASTGKIKKFKKKYK